MATDHGNTHQRGFAGLDTMVSDITPPASAPNAPDRNEDQTPAAQKAEPAQPILTGTAKPTRSSIHWWVIAPAAIGLIGWLAATSKPENHSASPGPTQTSSLTPAVTEALPPVGTGLVLNRPQIRYCLAEEVRLNAWYGKVNTKSDASVSTYNKAVDDYSSRCAKFRYSKGMLEEIRAEVAAKRRELQAQGMTRAAANP